LIEHYQERVGREPLSGLLTDLLTKVDYRGELARVYKDSGDLEARWNSVEELVNSLALYEQRTHEPSLFGFLEETALTGREDQRDEKDRQENAITLMTLHSAKGLEFPHVYMVGMEEGLLPHQRSVIENRSIDEERRLCYVGVTRAMNALTLTLCKARMKWGKAQHSIPSRFLLEMRGETERARRAAEAAEQLFRKGLDVETSAPDVKEKATRAGKKPTAKAKRAVTTPVVRPTPPPSPAVSETAVPSTGRLEKSPKPPRSSAVAPVRHKAKAASTRTMKTGAAKVGSKTVQTTPKRKPR
jgi:ATP-dependent exoDNAse (exonuclease V) beta subunit